MTPVTASPPISSLEVYNPAITRSYNSEIVLPYTFEQVAIAPNEYLFSEHINYATHRLSEIFDYLQSQTTMYDSVVPVYAESWTGDTLGAGQIRSVATNDSDEMWYIDGSTVVGADLANLGTLVSLSSSAVGEFEEPKSVAVNSQSELFVLDTFLIHQYDITNPSDPVYLAYYGGLGGAAVNDKFQNPRELHIDDEDNVWVSDFGNNVVKVYNRNLGHLRTIPRKVYSITTDDTYAYLLATDHKVYKHRRSDYGTESYFDTFIGAVRVEHDDTQPGFMYVQSSGKTEKWTVDGFKIGEFGNPSEPNGDLSDVVKPSNDNYVYVSDQNSIYKYLDFQRTMSILDSSISAVDPLESILVQNDEVAVPSIVYNDVLAKLEGNINTLSQAVTGCFTNTLDENDVLLETSIVSISPSANWCSVPRIPSNYIPSVNTFNEGFSSIYDCSQAFIDTVLNGKVGRNANNIDEGTFCWSLEALRCSGPQYKNTNTNPITFTELAYTPSLSCSPLTSECCENNFPWFTLDTTHVSGRTFNFEMSRVSGSELFTDDEIQYVIWSEDECIYTNDQSLDITFSEDGLYKIHHIAQDPGYLVHQGCGWVLALSGDYVASGTLLLDSDGNPLTDEDGFLLFE